eukprot:6177175-Pleurochrysis_carterae.AAC.2
MRVLARGARVRVRVRTRVRARAAARARRVELVSPRLQRAVDEPVVAVVLRRREPTHRVKVRDLGMQSALNPHDSKR